MKKFVKHIILFFILTISLSYVLYFILNKYEVNYYLNKSKIRWAQSIEKRHYNYCFIGSSRIANSINHKDFDSILNTTSINIATQGSAYAENYALLYQFLKSNTIDTLIVGFDLFGKVETKSIKNEYTALNFKHFDFFQSIDDSIIQSIYKDYTAPSYKVYLWQYLPMSRYIEYNHYFKVDTIINYIFTSNTNSNFDLNNGEQLLNDNSFKGDEYAIPQNITFTVYQNKYLNMILKLCAQKNIKTILITTPYYSIKSFNNENHNRYLKQLANRFSFEYYNFSFDQKWKDKKYFKDAIHVNNVGADLFTNLLIDKLTSNHFSNQAEIE